MISRRLAFVAAPLVTAVVAWRLLPPDRPDTTVSLREQLGGLGLEPQTTGMVWEELAFHGPGFTASLITSSVVPQFINFIASTMQTTCPERTFWFSETYGSASGAGAE